MNGVDEATIQAQGGQNATWPLQDSYSLGRGFESRPSYESTHDHNVHSRRYCTVAALR